MIKALLNKVEALKSALESGEIVRDVLLDQEDMLLEKQLGQLWDGKNSEGEDISPSYLEDDYFHSRDSARAYARWKDRITHNSKRNFAAPNLCITGKFYSELRVTLNESDIVFEGTTPFAQDVVSKYGLNQFGLMRSTWDEIMQENKKMILDRVKKIIL